ncbi:LacI family transcriptional regulator [Pedobacter sp. CG_S7]|uniref:LacI family DNA-binding transcriptional regulator n=1 Tax=Pedobacter sp. CG_S7 TaxID=3143930 RepID=UPI0033996C40
MSKITIKILAKELQLSVSTVSKAIKDSHEISNETKLRVTEMVKKLNYIPNAYAGSLGSRNSKTIGVVIPEVVDSFFALAINGIESIAQKNGYHVLIYLTHESFEKEKTILKDFESGRVDGVLMSVSRETTQHDHIDDLLKTGVPLVFFDRTFDEIETTQITTNDYESAYLATEHLIKNGCKKILFLSFSNILSITSKRLRGYQDALVAHNLALSEDNIIPFYKESKIDYLNLRSKLESPGSADGIIASVEKLAIPIYQVCEELQLNIPGDIQVISFSNLETAAFLNPPLTTITQPAFEIGKTAAAVLMKALGKKKIELLKEEIIIPSTIVIRKSTKC